MNEPQATTRPVLGEAAPNPKVDRDLMFALVEHRLLGRALEPVKVGRFIVLRRVGQGGMGVVYAAHDPELDRKVAIKLVDGAGDGTSEPHRELLREARAAAALTHPNVVTVYEVGVEGDAVFLAMEFVDGPTLRSWLAACARGWREIVGMFVAAGQGLAAAHRAGLVHRDFKPDNVLIGDDGRPRVADFGLARPAPQERSAPDDGTMPTGDGTFTAVAGTPRYMAPEQHDGHGIGPASDQFAFCVALYEALFGRHPFEGKNPAATVARVLAGALQAPGAAARGVPPRVVRLVLEGLRGSPQERHASMEVLIEGLHGTLQRRRRLIVGGAAVALAGLAAAVGYGVAPQPLLDSCADAASPMHVRWNPQVRQELEQAFVASEAPGAAETAVLVSDKLERYAGEWSAMREHSCRSTHEQGQRSALLMELSYACLERRLTGMSTLLDRFATIDATTVTRAVAAVDGLVPLPPCEDRSALMNQRGNALRGQTDRSARPEAHDEFHVLLEQVAQGEALHGLGQRDEALAIAQAVIEQAHTSELRAVEASALGLRGRLRRQDSELDVAEADLRRAAMLALEADVAEVAIEALVGLSDVLRRRREGVEHAPVLLDLARGLARREPVSPVFVLRVATEQAKVDRLQLRFDAARDGLRQALAEAEALGPDHTLVLSARNDLAANLKDLGELDEAERIFGELLPQRIAAQGPQHRSVGVLLLNLGVVAQEQQRWDVAAGWYDRALDFYDRIKDAPKAEQVRFVQGVMARERGRLDEAERLLARVLEDRHVRQGPKHADLAEVLDALAEVERQQGRHDAAMEHAQRAVALLERAHGPDYLDLRLPLVTLGKTELDRGRPAEAAAVLRRAHAIVYGTEVDGLVRGEVCFDLARATIDDPVERAAALELAREAARLFTAAGARAATLRAEVDAWLLEHAG
jgi:tetratricopeptide (TPR) repeat protein